MGKRFEVAKLLEARCRRVLLVVGVELGKHCERLALLLLQLVVAASQSLGEGIIRIAVASLAQDRVLLASEIGQPLSVPFPVRFALLGRAVIK